MNRRQEPAMPTSTGGTRGAPAPYTPAALRALRRGWALTRWIGLVVGVGLGVAALIAIVVGLLVTLLDSSL
jgi:hypothetical protein